MSDEREAAEQVSKIVREAISLGIAACAKVAEVEEAENADRFRKLFGGFYGNALVEVLMPIESKFPDLKPIETAENGRTGELSTSTAESQVEQFLAAAKVAIDAIKADAEKPYSLTVKSRIDDIAEAVSALRRYELTPKA